VRRVEGLSPNGLENLIAGYGSVRLGCTVVGPRRCTLVGMDVAVSDLRAHLSEWLERARSGQEVVITDRGVPVARLLGIGATAALERLTAEGIISRPSRPVRPTASSLARPRARASVAELVSEQRR
jgi:prevent-host-death family protein